MNEPHAPTPAGTEPDKKPVIELLRDIRAQAGFPPREPRHIVNPKLVNNIVFGSSVVSVSFCALVSLMMIWGGIEPDFGLKCIGSTCVVLMALAIFRGLNESLTE